MSEVPLQTEKPSEIPQACRQKDFFVELFVFNNSKKTMFVKYEFPPVIQVFSTEFPTGKEQDTRNNNQTRIKKQNDKHEVGLRRKNYGVCQGCNSSLSCTAQGFYTNSRLAGQLVASAGSIGANYREANDALGKKDFQSRLRIARKEAKETLHWLDCVKEANPPQV